MRKAQWVYIDDMPAQRVRDEVRQQIIFEHYVKVRKKKEVLGIWSALIFGNNDQLKAFIEKVERK